MCLLCASLIVYTQFFNKFCHRLCEVPRPQETVVQPATSVLSAFHTRTALRCVRFPELLLSVPFQQFLSGSWIISTQRLACYCLRLFSAPNYECHSYLVTLGSFLFASVMLGECLWRCLPLTHTQTDAVGGAVSKEDRSSRHATSQGPSWRWSMTSLTMYMHKVFFIIILLHASTCFEHYVLIIRRSKLYYTACGIVTPVGGRPVHSPLSTGAPDGHLQVWWYQMLYNRVLTSRWWAHSARNM